MASLRGETKGNRAAAGLIKEGSKKNLPVPLSLCSRYEVMYYIRSTRPEVSPFAADLNPSKCKAPLTQGALQLVFVERII
jgi:hypothetical protein